MIWPLKVSRSTIAAQSRGSVKVLVQHRTPQGRDRDGTKALIGVLLLHRTLPTEAVLAGIDAAVGWCSLKFGTGVIRVGVGDPGASFVTPSPISCRRTCPHGSLPEPIC